ncbi:hypothetical protein RJ639_002824 [Escallonia herrerae]|uniref:Endonuclease/exonuclease/phosphatase domain-containing protein n=1 Tax=Escallonia herrerae TaxID=1293975 RepID=A0AA88W3E8_9ASTE|nr:hypothetical protein RJ639_002824 [Escallonia herrerae]
MSVSLTVMTFNLLEDQAEDSPNTWQARKDLCVSVITSYSPMILCTQQGVKSQLEYLQQCLPGYNQMGISRKGSEDTSDEHCTIFYDKEKIGRAVGWDGCGEHGVVGDMRDAWPSARVRKNVSLIRTYHGFKGDKQGVVEFLKLIFRALCLCWDRQTQDLHVDWILFRGRSLIPVSCEVINDNIDGRYPSSHYPIFSEFMLPRTVRFLEGPTRSGT